ncbi:MAG: phosphoribosylaminoimidazolesuccinocarboxamide synthase [Spirochaetales bacterium]|nr:phosphoribosylaminoimidazolesuccinocarboxamide synthase [Spirochaetales bacterium]
MDKRELINLIPSTVKDLDVEELAKLLPGKNITGKPLYKGKVRDILDLGSQLLIFTSDRISAFDRVLTTIPCKGELLNRISVFWFEKTADIIKNHIIKELSPRSVLVKKCNVVPLEIIVRGYLTGSAWRDYKAGRSISGVQLPAGMKQNQAFPEPFLSPSTKAEKGVHDEPISREEILKRDIVTESLWNKIEKAALSLFKRGTEIAAAQGLILVDTKYEFGLCGGELFVVDEIHTPDSSRYWYSDTYAELFERGEDQRKLDKEYLRKWLMEHNFMGNGEPPVIPEDIKAEVALRYIKAFETITGKPFKPASLGEKLELEAVSSEIAGI